MKCDVTHDFIVLGCVARDYASRADDKSPASTMKSCATSLLLKLVSTAGLGGKFKLASR